MTSKNDTQVMREAVGIFTSADALENAIVGLMGSGFDRAEISLLAAEPTVDAKLGHKYRRVTELEDDAATPRDCYVSIESIGDAEGALIGGLLYVGALAAVGAVVASGGTLAAAITGAALGGGTGGLIGSVLAKLVGDRHAQTIEEQLAHGGLLLWVQTRDADHEAKAVEILRKHSGADVHVHSLPVDR
jgi:hypothetical protein